MGEKFVGYGWQRLNGGIVCKLQVCLRGNVLLEYSTVSTLSCLGIERREGRPDVACSPIGYCGIWPKYHHGTYSFGIAS